jgi:hypothetical protein
MEPYGALPRTQKALISRLFPLGHHDSAPLGTASAACAPVHCDSRRWGRRGRIHGRSSPDHRCDIVIEQGSKESSVVEYRPLELARASRRVDAR